MKKILSFIMAMFMTSTIAGAATVATFPSGEVYADDCNKILVFGLRPWYYGLAAKYSDATGGGQTCAVNKPGSDDAELAKFVWSIVLNISYDLALMVGYAALIFVVWGGFKYIMSTGEPQKVTEAKKMITNALIGLVIGVLATIIINTILIILRGAAQA
jgi:hypothetical protein